MIPVRDVIPSRTFPGVTIAIIVLNGLAFLYELGLPSRELSVFLETWGFVPASFFPPAIVSSMFLHGGTAHLAGNMLFLWIFGDNVEDRMGHGRFVVFYLLAGIIAALAHAWSDPMSAVPTVGASGAIAGVMGAYFVLYPHSRILTWVPPIFLFEVPATVFLGLWFLLQLVSGVSLSVMPAGGTMTGGIAFWAHVAGFAAGAVLITVFRRPERTRVEWWNDRDT
jgi:membrane associated rhomboid family serine protease